MQEKSAPKRKECMETSPRAPSTLTVALAGNPNVGKSSIFNRLTGMHQHTGNWPGKTVALAEGVAHHKGTRYSLIDLPGTYSLLSHSPEEEIARNYICFSKPDAVIVVCDATSPEKGLRLALQILECGVRTLLCVNLLDEAERRGIRARLDLLEKRLGVPVIGTVARKKNTLTALLDGVKKVVTSPDAPTPYRISYPPPLEEAITLLEEALRKEDCRGISPRWLALQLLIPDGKLEKEISATLGENFIASTARWNCLEDARKLLASHGITEEMCKDLCVGELIREAEELSDLAFTHTTARYAERDRRLDRILTGKITAYPVMLLLLALIFWLTVSFAGTLSDQLAQGLGWLGIQLSRMLLWIGTPPWLYGALIDGVWCVLSSVIAVMLPPMAIFFPLFTLLEDLGYLPRIAYNLDRPFCRCNACGKQALTMCMGFGCNAAGVVGCRIIDSPRERMLAILTNSFVPCNGRFPALLSLLSMFFVFGLHGIGASLVSALLLAVLILLAVLMTLAATKLLSHTLLRGTPSAFTLELPPFRRPELGKILIRSLFDRTLFVLGRAAAVAAPLGLLLWLLANVTLGERSLLILLSELLDPLGRCFGMDGILLLAFLLGLPANEIVLPIAMMIYRAEGSLTQVVGITEMKNVFLANGWSTVTALCTLLFFLFHWPCSTTLLTIKKETGSIGYTLLAAALPTVIGLLLCFAITTVARIF